MGIVVEGMMLEDLKSSLAVSYGLETAILDRLVLRRAAGKKKDGSSNYKYIVDDDAELPSPDAFLSGGYNLMVRYEKGDEREVDTTCDSNYMEKIMPLVGGAIRNAHHWVPFSTPIFCIWITPGATELKTSLTGMLRTFARCGTSFAFIRDLVRRRPTCWT